MKDLLLEDYELVDQDAEETKYACVGCAFINSACFEIAGSECSEDGNTDKVWKLKQKTK